MADASKRNRVVELARGALPWLRLVRARRVLRLHRQAHELSFLALLDPRAQPVLDAGDSHRPLVVAVSVLLLVIAAEQYPAVVVLPFFHVVISDGAVA